MSEEYAQVFNFQREFGNLSLAEQRRALAERLVRDFADNKREFSEALMHKRKWVLYGPEQGESTLRWLAEETRRALRKQGIVRTEVVFTRRYEDVDFGRNGADVYIISVSSYALPQKVAGLIGERCGD